MCRHPPPGYATNCTWNTAAGHMLFPSCLAAWRIAGLPDPGEEAKAYLSAE